MLINPLQALLWTFRRSEHDVINLYNSLSPVMRLATGGKMLNFGYWEDAPDPVSAQKNLCSLVGRVAELDTAKRLVDVGSGLSAPATQWKSAHSSLEISCVNINFQQLLSARETEMSLLNANSTLLPLTDRSADRIVALESAQHFKPLNFFVKESRRVLEPRGSLVIAMPVVLQPNTFFKLGILSWTWSSEHYRLEYVKDVIGDCGFEISEIMRIGHQVYEPLAYYYIRNRDMLRKKILESYPSFLEKILFKSLTKMSEVSRKEIIDYVIIKAA